MGKMNSIRKEKKENYSNISKLREKSLDIAECYVRDVSELEFMRKNSNFTACKVRNYVCNFLLTNETIKRVFSQRIDKILNLQ